MHASLRLHTHAQSSSCVLVLLVLDKLLNEHVASLTRRKFSQIFDGFIRLGGNKALRLDFKERGGNKKEVACHIKIESAHSLDFIKILIDDVVNRDRPDINALPTNKVQKQVEGTLETFSTNAI